MEIPEKNEFAEYIESKKDPQALIEFIDSRVNEADSWFNIIQTAVATEMLPLKGEEREELKNFYDQVAELRKETNNQEPSLEQKQELAEKLISLTEK